MPYFDDSNFVFMKALEEPDLKCRARQWKFDVIYRQEVHAHHEEMLILVILSKMIFAATN